MKKQSFKAWFHFRKVVSFLILCKTDILYFTNAHEPNLQKEYWYFDVKNDGFTLDSKRKAVHGNNDLGKVEAFDLRKNYKEEVKQHIIENGFEIVNLIK